MKLVSVETPEKSVCKMTFSASAEELEAASNAVYERTRASYTIKGFAKGRIITVFGCGGDRDPSKRPLMGLAAGKGSDLCVVTTDNPRTENPAAIIEQILPGLKQSGCEYYVVENRKEAIQKALELAQKDDVVLLAGKGHEPYQEINGVRHPFDEKAIVHEILHETIR